MGKLFPWPYHILDDLSKLSLRWGILLTDSHQSRLIVLLQPSVFEVRYSCLNKSTNLWMYMRAIAGYMRGSMIAGKFVSVSVTGNLTR